MANKRLAINLIANTISYSTTILVAFFLTPYLIKTLGTEAYGFYPLANNFVNYISIFTIAINSMASRYITIEIIKGNTKSANIYFSSAFFSNLILACILFVPMLIIVIFLEHILNIPVNLITEIKILFMLVFASMLTNLIASVFSVAVFATNKLDMRSYLEIFQGVSRIILYIVLFHYFTPSIIYVGLVALILSCFYFMGHFILTKKLLPKFKITKKSFDFSAIKELLRSGLWNSVNQLGSILTFSTSILLANIFIGPEASGQLSIVQTIPSFINGVISMLTGLFLPTITKKYAERDKIGLVEEVKKSQKVMGLVTNIPIMVFIAYGKEFFELWIPSESSELLQILSIIMIAHLLLVGVVWPISNLNIVMNKIKIPSILMVVNGVINISMSIILLTFTNYGVYVISLTMMITNLLWFGLFIPIYSSKTLKISIFTFYPAIFKTIVGSFFIYIFAKLVSNVILINSWSNLVLACIVSGIVGLIVNSILLFKRVKVILFLKKIFNKH